MSSQLPAAIRRALEEQLYGGRGPSRPGAQVQGGEPILSDFEILEINPLLGIDRNKSTGADPDNQIHPLELFNLVPDRHGSLIPFGRKAALSPAVALPGTPIGFDNRGLSSFYAAGIFQLFDGTSMTPGTETYAAPTNVAHLPGTGPYKSASEFLAFTNEDTSPYLVEPFDITPAMTPEAQAASDVIATNTGGDDITGVAFHTDGTDNYWVVCTLQGHIFASVVPVDNSVDPFSTFTQVATLGVPLRGVAYGAGIFVVVGDNDTVYRNTVADTILTSGDWAAATSNGGISGGQLQRRRL